MTKEDILAMPLENFVTRQRLLNTGMSENAVTRLLNNLMHRTTLKTVKDLILAIEEKIKDEEFGYGNGNLPGVGPKTSKNIQLVLASHGIKIRSL